MEFIIGLKPSPVDLTPNSKLLELILVTERISKITIVGQKNGDRGDSGEIVSAIVFDDGDIDLRVRDGTANTDKEVDEFSLSRKKNSQNSIDLDTPFFDEIVMQQTVASASDQPDTILWS